MKKAEMPREYSKWETLGVCFSWFLAAHNKTQWTTFDLGKLYQVKEGLNLWNILNKMSKFFFDACQARKSLTDITNFSRTASNNLFFSYYSFIYEEDLMFAAERMPNIEKLVLPDWWYRNKNTIRCAFSTWKNLKTLIIAHDCNLTGTLDFQVVGENCSNLTNLKYLGYLETNVADQIVRYLQNLKRLSLRGSVVSTSGVLSLITNLQKLAILNLSHCWKLDPYDYSVTTDSLVQAANQKLDKFFICSQDCRFCKYQSGFSTS